MEKVLNQTHFSFPGQKSFYKGKVRDVYNINDQYLVMIASDRISAFDVVLPRGIPYKGQVLNQIASRFLDATATICPNWKISSPDPNVTIGRFCNIYPIEMIIRGYLTGSSWRTYQTGARTICGVPIPDGMKEHQRFPEPIITPTTKAKEGHDEDITEAGIIRQGLIPDEEYAILKKYTLSLFQKGTEMAAQQGLILVDTKYEFGKAPDGTLMLIDEVHTPDSSRFWKRGSYEALVAAGQEPENFDKEFIRLAYAANGYKGDGVPPIMPDDLWVSGSQRYIQIYEMLTGKAFEPGDYPIDERLTRNLRAAGVIA